MIKVLLIEDNYLLRELYERVIHKAGFEAISANNGADGIELATREKPNIILLDIMLPKLNGIDTLKVLKDLDITKEIPVYLLTNLGQDRLINTALDLGAERYLLKTNTPPLKLIELLQEFAEESKT